MCLNEPSSRCDPLGLAGSGGLRRSGCSRGAGGVLSRRSWFWPGQKLKPGTLVLLRNSHHDGRKNGKLEKIYLGPYEVAENLNKGVLKTGILVLHSLSSHLYT